MDERTRILKISQSIYLTKNNRYNDVEGDEETEFINQTIDWINQWVEELEVEADWNYVRRQGANLGTIVDATSAVPLPAAVRTLVISPYRSLYIAHGGIPVARFTVVSPNQLSQPADEGLVEDRVTVVGRKILFSRDLKAEEIGGDVIADVIDFIPRLSLDTGLENVDMLDLVTPRQLIVLGVAKNATLPDIVQGGTSPSHTQKYNDLLSKAIQENNKTSEVFIVPRENFGYIGGIW